jgi:hypothetical protein
MKTNSNCLKLLKSINSPVSIIFVDVIEIIQQQQRIAGLVFFTICILGVSTALFPKIKFILGNIFLIIFRQAF